MKAVPETLRLPLVQWCLTESRKPTMAVDSSSREWGGEPTLGLTVVCEHVKDLDEASVATQSAPKRIQSFSATKGEQ